MACLQDRKTLLRLTSCTRCHASTLVSSTERSSGGEMPALLKSTSTRPKASRTCSYISMTRPSWVTSTCSERSPGAFSATSTPATRAPSRWNTRTVAAPIPPAAPVITQTLPSRRPMSTGRVVDRLDLGVGVEGVRAELAPVARLLEAAEGRGDAHRRVGVDRDHAGLDRARDPQRLGAVAGPDRPREPVDRVVAKRDRLGLVAERQHDRHRAEDLLARRALVARDRAQHGRREPVSRAGRRLAPDGDR